MEDKGKIPMLLELWFGEAAERVQGGASERLLHWCEAFEAWLEDLRCRYKPSSHKQAVLTWRRLARQSGKMPWELEAGDIEQFTTWMQGEGYAVTTISNSLGYVASFYRWCGERGVDVEKGAAFNPAAEVKRPKVERYAGAKLLSRGEVKALLGILERDKSPLGRRERAFMLARLCLGVPLSNLQQLRWGQIEVDKEGTWVRWRQGKERTRLPGEVWEAIQAYLEASGRRKGMQERDYVFAPLTNLFGAGEGKAAEDWVESRYISSGELLANLKLYGRQVKIPEEKLTLMTLRRTATRLQMEKGGSLEEMQAFLDSREVTKSAKFRLGKLPKLPEEEGGRDEQGRIAGEDGFHVPVRIGKPFKPGEGLTHGNYARELPAAEVAEVLAEGTQGVETELVGMRILARKLLEMQARTTNRMELANLMAAYTQATHWLEMLIREEKKLDNPNEEDKEAEEALVQLAVAMGVSNIEAYLAEAWAEALGEEVELNAAARQSTEEIASTRLVLRRTFDLATDNPEARELVRYVNIYGYGCVRLVKLLGIKGSNKGKLAAYFQNCINQAIDKLAEEWGLE
jgi:integrase